MRLRAGFVLGLVLVALASRRIDAQIITEFPITTAGSDPGGITAGPDGNLWFTEFGVGKIGRITTAGTVTEFPAAGQPPAHRGRLGWQPLVHRDRPSTRSGG